MLLLHLISLSREPPLLFPPHYNGDVEIRELDLIFSLSAVSAWTDNYRENHVDQTLAVALSGVWLRSGF